MAYAEGTSVSVEKSKAELDGLLEKYGATQRGIFVDDAKGLAIVVFRHAMGDGVAGRAPLRAFQIEVPMPRLNDVFPTSADEQPRGWGGWSVTKRQAWATKQHQQVSRARWRALVLMLKAKLEAIELGISTLEREFLADVVLPDGRRLHAALATELEKFYLTGGQPKLLGAGMT